MNLHETAMGQRFFNVQLPALINTLKDIAAALSRSIPSAISFPADPRFLTSLYYGEYEADVFKPDKRLAPFNQAVQQILYTTRPARANETDGVQYHFVDEKRLSELQDAGKVIELRAYQVVGGVWKYFTVDDEQTDLDTKDYLAIGTLVSYEKLRDYYGAERIVPIYVEVEDGMRLARALDRERSQIKPNYDEMCRRFLADSADFSEENLEKAGIKKRFQNEELQKCVEKITEFIFQSK